MKNLNSNRKIKGLNYSDITIIRGKVVLGEDIEQTELKLFLGFLQDLAKAIMAQTKLYQNYGDLYKNTIEGLEKDLDDTNQEIDAVQRILVHYSAFDRN